MEFRFKKRKRWYGCLACLVLLLGLRLCLGWFIKIALNHRLSRLTDYSGHIDGVGLSLWRGAYQIEEMTFLKKSGRLTTPFFYAPWTDIGVQWGPLFHGQVVASVMVRHGRLNFVNGPSKDDSQFGFGENWLPVLESLVPVDINQLRFEDGEIHFTDPAAKPPVDLHLQHLDLQAENLSTSQEIRGTSLGTVSATAGLMTDAKLAVQAHFDRFAKNPTFDYSATILGLKLAELNPFLLRYAAIDVQAGSLDIYSEAAASGGDYKSYVKPIVRGLKVMKPDEKLRPGMLAKKMLVGFLGWLFKNRQGDVATKFELNGTFAHPQSSNWDAFVYLFQNAFIKALPHTLEGGVKALAAPPIPAKP